MLNFLDSIMAPANHKYMQMHVLSVFYLAAMKFDDLLNEAIKSAFRPLVNTPCGTCQQVSVNITASAFERNCLLWRKEKGERRKAGGGREAYQFESICDFDCDSQRNS